MYIELSVMLVVVVMFEVYRLCFIVVIGCV